MEQSWLWDTTAPVVGDATSRINYEQFNKWLFSPLTNRGWYEMGMLGETAQRFMAHVVPGHLNDLELRTSVTTPSVITIRPGAAIGTLFLYENTEDVQFNIEPLRLSGNVRFDQIMLEIDARQHSPTGNSVRLIYKRGNETTSRTTALPPSSVYEVYGERVQTVQVPLWRIEVDNSDPVTLQVRQDHVYDMREFLSTAEATAQSPQNLLKNSEFMAYSTYGVAPFDAPECWGNIETTGGFAIISPTAFIPPMTRGRAMRVQTTLQGQGITQRIYAPSNKNAPYRTYTVEGLVIVANSADIAQVRLAPLRHTTLGQYEEFGTPLIITVDGRVTTVQHVRRTTTFDVGDEEIKWLQLSVIGMTAADDFRVGQFVVTPGYFSGGLRQVHETIMYSRPVPDSAWDGDAKNGTVTLNLSNVGVFLGQVLPFSRAVIIGLRAMDSGSVSGSPSVSILDRAGGSTFIHLSLQNKPNSRLSYTEGTVPVNYTMKTTANPDAQIAVVSVAVATLSVWIELLGVIT